MASNNARSEPKPLNPSKLGTKAYWEESYTRELQANKTHPTDEGIIWFEESNAENIVISHLARYADRNLVDRARCRFLDLGTGNGHMLFALREDDKDGEEVRWTGEMVGVDYSEKSVDLARVLHEQRVRENDGGGEKEDFAAIRFEQWDLLLEQPGAWISEGFDVVLDKGTFDAISLMSREDGSSHPCETYREKVVGLIKPGCFLVITSCNWTKDELVDWLVPPDSELTFFDEAKYPTFTFGGQTGQSVVTAVFRRRPAE